MQIKKSLLVSFLNSNFNTAVMFLVGLWLARILTPTEIGAFSIAVVIVGLTSVFRDFGAQTYLIQKKDMNQRDIGAAFGLMLLNSWLLGGMLWVLAPYFGVYFQQPEIAPAVRVLVISFLIIPFNGVVSALFIREMQAQKTAIVLSMGTLAYCVAAIAIAATGAGASALAWANVGNVAANLIGFLWLKPKKYDIRPSLTGWIPVVQFGRGVISTNIATVGNQSVSELAVGRLVGAHDVGVFSRANGVVSLFNQAVTPMLNYNVLPYVAHAGYSRAEMAKQLIKAGQLLSVLALPVYIFLAIFSEQVLLILYGSQWTGGSALVGLLCLVGMVKSPFMHLPLAVQAVHVHAAAWPAWCSLLTRVVLVAVLKPTALLDLIVLLSVGDFVATFVSAVMAKRHLGISPVALLVAQVPSCLAAAIFGAVALVCAHVTGELGMLAGLLLTGAVASTAWVVAVVMLRHPICMELQPLWRKAQSLSKRGSQRNV